MNTAHRSIRRAQEIVKSPKNEALPAIPGASCPESPRRRRRSRQTRRLTTRIFVAIPPTVLTDRERGRFPRGQWHPVAPSRNEAVRCSWNMSLGQTAFPRCWPPCWPSRAGARPWRPRPGTRTWPARVRQPPRTSDPCSPCSSPPGTRKAARSRPPSRPIQPSMPCSRHASNRWCSTWMATRISPGGWKSPTCRRPWCSMSAA